ncbi:MAG: polyphosphate polymerase domain-containing protein [Clostridia bacterium]|nr:polyphosphate polymerase domain-containing protein [Clostridia bacterium]
MNSSNYQQCFRRYEIKYLVTEKQRVRLEAAVLNHMSPDKYGESVIYNIYYDTPDYRIIRQSLEKPYYKEKLRMRSYGRSGENDEVFLELKKKCGEVVFKRRISMSQNEAVAALTGDAPLPRSQIGNEIGRFRDFYADIEPRVFLSYERAPYYSEDAAGFRITFDRNILWRDTDFTLDSEAFGDALLLPGQSLMEIKTTDAIPLWLTALLTENRIYKASFSKYGKAYGNMIDDYKKTRCSICSTKSFQEFLTAEQRPA